MAVRRILKQMVHQILWLSSDELVQVVSLVVIVVIMTGEGLRADMAATRQIEFSPSHRTADSGKGQIRMMPRDEENKIRSRQGSKVTTEALASAAVKTPLPKSANTQGNSNTSLIREDGLLSDLLGQPQQTMSGEDKKTDGVRLEQLTSANDQKPEERNVTREFRGVLLEDGNGTSDNIERLSFMLYRLIKTFQVSSVIEVPCTRSLSWLPQFVHHLEFEVPGFKYYCVLQTDEEYHYAKKLVGNTTSLKLSIHPEYWKLPLPKAELGLLWHAFGYLAPDNAWNLVQMLRDLNVKFVIVPNNPLVERNSGHASRHGRVNVRRSPYSFGTPVRIIHNVSKNETEPKQLLFYNVTSIRDFG